MTEEKHEEMCNFFRFNITLYAYLYASRIVLYYTCDDIFIRSPGLLIPLWLEKSMN